MKILTSIIVVFMLVLFASCGSNTESGRAGESLYVGNGEMKELNQELEKDSLNYELYLKRAKMQLELGQINKAMQDINKSMDLNEDNVDVFLILADIYFAMGMPDNCNAALLRALEVDKEDTRTHIKMAELNLLLQNHSLAMGYIDQALAISSFNPEAYYVRAMLYMSRKDTTQAIRNFQLALNQREDFYEPLIQLGAIYTARHNELAEQYLNKAIQLYPQSLQARYQLALYYQEHAYLDEAVLHYDTILMRQPGNKHVLFNLGYLNLVYFLKYEKAIEYFDEALLVDPNYVEALFNKGLALEELGRVMAAQEVYREVLNKRDNYSLAIQALNRIDGKR
jgi:tetratricopeptide (TPR) repeat protein